MSSSILCLCVLDDLVLEMEWVVLPFVAELLIAFALLALPFASGTSVLVG